MTALVLHANTGPNYSLPEWKSEVVGEPTAIVSMSISRMNDTYDAIAKHPGVPLYCYNWDCYEWAWSSPREGEYDYHRYGRLLRMSKEVWVPSVCTGRRTTQWWGIKNWHVVLSNCPWWDYPDTTDEGYILCTLREIPDPWWGKFEQACEELGLPYVMTQHDRSYENYQKVVAHCRFLCAPLWELSTGGLPLMEGYYLGKPCLLSDSEWNGGADYMRARATYFKHGDWDDFKSKLLHLYHNPYVSKDHASWIKSNYSSERMVNDMLARMQ